MGRRRLYLYELALLLYIVFLVSCPALAVSPRTFPQPASAACKISCTVAGIAEWSETYFPDIDLDELNAGSRQTGGQTALMLYTNGDVAITADNGNAAELSIGSDTLTTKYKLRYNGLGIRQTGDNSTVWYSFDTFLKKDTKITHAPAVGTIEVILSVNASVKEINSDNSWQYTAVQTLTVCWKS